MGERGAFSFPLPISSFSPPPPLPQAILADAKTLHDIKSAQKTTRDEARLAHKSELLRKRQARKAAKEAAILAIEAEEGASGDEEALEGQLATG